MQTARVTILMSPEKKAAFDAIAAKRGFSTGEFFRQAGDRASNDDLAEEEQVEDLEQASEVQATALRDLAKDVISSDKRVVRLETMVEVATARAGSFTRRLPKQ